MNNFLPQPSFLLKKNIQIDASDRQYQFKYGSHFLNHKDTIEEEVEPSIKMQFRPLNEQIVIDSQLLYAHKRDIWIECYLP